MICKLDHPSAPSTSQSGLIALIANLTVLLFAPLVSLIAAPENEPMNYSDGQKALIGDKVMLGLSPGVVVISLDDNAYSTSYESEEWAYMGHGTLINFRKFGLIHYKEPEDDLILLIRASNE